MVGEYNEVSNTNQNVIKFCYIYERSMDNN